MRYASARAAIVAANVAAAVLLVRGALAHHSPAGYDMQAQRTIEGTITEYEWDNPHVYLSVRENRMRQLLAHLRNGGHLLDQNIAMTILISHA